MGAFDWINENIAAPLISAVTPDAGVETGPVSGQEQPVIGQDPTTPDVDRAKTLSESLQGAGQSASATLDGAGTASIGSPLDWLFGEDEKPIKAKKLPLPNFENLISPEDRKRLEEQEEFAEKIEGEEGYNESQGIYRKSAHRVGQGYATDAEIAAPDPEAEVALDSEEERLAALDSFTQNDKFRQIEGDQGTDKCGATSIMAAAMLAEGKGGIKSIIDMVGADADMGELYKKELEKAGVLEKLDGEGNLSNDDLRMVQGMLHENLRMRMPESDRERTAGVGTEAMKEVIQGNPAIREMFEKNEMSVNLIDNDGERDSSGNVGAEHFVLQVGREGAEGEMIYDPLARRDGQVITRDHQLADYHNARNSQVGGMVVPP